MAPGRCGDTAGRSCRLGARADGGHRSGSSRGGGRRCVPGAFGAVDRRAGATRRAGPRRGACSPARRRVRCGSRPARRSPRARDRRRAARPDRAAQRTGPVRVQPRARGAGPARAGRQDARAARCHAGARDVPGRLDGVGGGRAACARRGSAGGGVESGTLGPSRLRAGRAVRSVSRRSGDGCHRGARRGRGQPAPGLGRIPLRGDLRQRSRSLGPPRHARCLHALGLEELGGPERQARRAALGSAGHSHRCRSH